MMIHPQGVALFVEVPKTGSTACTLHLRKHGWFQNGMKGTKQIPGTTFPGRHSYLDAAARQLLDQTEVTVYGVVRNPWDRMASLWRASAPGTVPFLEYMQTGKFRHNHIDIMTAQQRTWLEFADHVIRYEELGRNWDQMSYQFGHLPVGPIPVSNRSKRRASPNWTQEEIDLIADRFALDIQTYGYTGPSKPS